MRIGFIGFGEAGSTLAGGLRSAGVDRLCRSIVVKGLEALMCECVLGAARYDADEYVFRSLNESFPGLDWRALANYREVVDLIATSKNV